MNLGRQSRTMPTGRTGAAGAFVATAVIAAGLAATPAPVAQAAPAPEPESFTAGVGPYAGTVPDGSCFVDVRVTGGAGGHDLVAGSTSQPGANGAAARITARYSVVPGQVFAGVVGGGGAQDGTAGDSGGGNGGTATADPGAGGGGWTSLQLDGVDVVVAGGGGGSGGGQSLTSGAGGDAGLPTGPGVAAGSAGTVGDDTADAVAGGGGGGGQAAPGAGGVHNVEPSLNGAAGAGRTGGDGGTDLGEDSGGGAGGGWFGGGGGASTFFGSGAPGPDDIAGAGGGGGASYVAATSPGGSGVAVSGVTSTAVGTRATAGDGQAGDVLLDFAPCAYDLAVSKSVDNTTPAPGATVTWTVTVTNNGPDPMTRGDLVTIDDTLPGPGTTTITSVTATGGSNDRGLVRGPVSCGVSPGDPVPATLTCARPYADDVSSSPDSGSRGLDSGETVTITYAQTIPVGTPSGTTLTNVAAVTDRGAVVDNSAGATVTVGPAAPVPTPVPTTPVPPTPVPPTPVPPAPGDDVDLVLAKRAVSGSQTRVGDSVRYRLTVRNRGTDTAPAPIRLTDRLPEGLELVSARGRGWTCQARTRQDVVRCVRKRALGADRRAPSVVVVAQATRAALGRVVNVASVRVAGESDRSNNRGRARITVVPAQLPGTGFRLGARRP